MPEKPVMQVRVPQDLMDQLQEIAGECGITMSEAVRRLLVLSIQEVKKGAWQITGSWEMTFVMDEE